MNRQAGIDIRVDHADQLLERPPASRLWQFVQNGQPVPAPIARRVTLNNGEAMREFALAGLGRAMRPGFIVAAELAARRLEPVLTDCATRDLPIHALWPPMAGYPADFSAAVTAASSTVGPMIPPSVPMNIVGALSGLSVGRMFMAGAIPGLLLGVGMMVTCYILARRRNYPVQPWQGLGELARSFASALWAIAMTALIIGGLVTGIATPTETAIVACLYAFFVGAFIYRGLRVRDVLFVGMFMETIAALTILFVPLLALATSVGSIPSTSRPSPS